jgi:hypothetical protein
MLQRGTYKHITQLKLMQLKSQDKQMQVSAWIV